MMLVIRVYDETGNVIQTPEQVGEFKKGSFILMSGGFVPPLIFLEDVPALVAELQAIGEDPEKFMASVNAAEAPPRTL